MHLESPYFLILLILIAIWWKILRTTSQNSFFSQEILAKLLVDKRTVSKQPKLFLLALILIVVALSRPTLHVKKEHELQTHEISMVAIALDISHSMLAKDVYPSRLEFSKMAIEKVFEKLVDFRIALIAFANDGFLVSPMSEDKASLSFLLKYLNEESMSSQGSSVSSAIASAKKVYEPFPNATKELLIITDGADGEKIEEAIERAQKEQIRVYLILVGTTQGAMIYTPKGEALKDQKGNLVITKRADTLKELALQTGGAYMTTTGELSEITWLCEQIALKASKKSVQHEEPYDAKELFYYPLGMALILLFFAFHALHVKRISVILVLFLGALPAHSSMLDWWDISQAKSNYDKGSYEEAIRLYEQVYTSKKDDASAYNLANALYKAKQYEKALPLFDGIHETSLHQKALHNKGNTLAQLGRVDEAIMAYKKALTLQSDEDTQYNLELLKQQKKDKDQNQSKESPKQENEKDKNKSEKSQENNDQKTPKNENKNSEKTQDNMREKASPSEAKPMEEQEAKKWERELLHKEPSTQPMKIFKSDKMENNNAITW